MSVKAFHDRSSQPPPLSMRGTDGQDTRLPPPSRWRRSLPWSVVAVVVAATVWLLLRWAYQGSADATVALAGLRIDSVAIADVRRELHATGRVVAAASPALYAPSAGVVTYAIQAGDSVHKGDVLAVIDGPALRNQLQQEQATLNRLRSESQRIAIAARQQAVLNQQQADLAQVDLQAAQREMDRARRSFAKQVISELDFRAAEDELQRARVRARQSAENAGLAREAAAFEAQNLALEVERQQLLVTELVRQVDELQIRSPVTGMVGSLALNQKAAVIPQQALLTVVDLTSFEVEIDAPESYADELALAMPVDIKVGASNYPGVITAIAPEIIASQVRVRLKFSAETPPNLRQNQRLSARVVLEQRPQVLSVARGAFVDADGGRSAFRLTGDRAERVPIVLGAIGIDRVEILSGLAAGDRIIVSDTAAFRDHNRLLLTE